MKSPIQIGLKATVPAKSAGRLLDALTDMIRPFTEKRGLRADQVRLQREEVLIEIARRALERTQIERKKIKGIPNKALVPLLEKASLESSIDETMIELWANLLASAATGNSGNVPRYVSILSEINSRQARLLQRIILANNPRRERRGAERLLDDLWAADQAGILLRLRQDHSKADINGFASTIVDHLKIDGIALGAIVFNKGKEQWDSGGGGRKKGFFPIDKHRVDLDILESLNLLKECSFKNVEFLSFEVSVFFYRVTPLAVDMFASCNPHLLSRREN
jgi:hypothetical protein